MSVFLRDKLKKLIKLIDKTTQENTIVFLNEGFYCKGRKKTTTLQHPLWKLPPRPSHTHKHVLKHNWFITPEFNLLFLYCHSTCPLNRSWLTKWSRPKAPQHHGKSWRDSGTIENQSHWDLIRLANKVCGIPRPCSESRYPQMVESWSGGEPSRPGWPTKNAATTYPRGYDNIQWTEGLTCLSEGRCLWLHQKRDAGPNWAA